jgi:endoglycosylceramidase
MSKIKIITNYLGDKIFIDENNRQVIFKGYNISGATKLIENNNQFISFKNLDDANKSFKELKNNGYNLIRYLISWEGISPTEDDILNKKYLDDIVCQLKLAINHGFYVIIDYHFDLFSRYLFNENNKYTGNGAPQWAVPDDISFKNDSNYSSWGLHWLLNKDVKKSYKRFWENENDLQTKYLIQLEGLLKHLKLNLNNDEIDYILGIDPFNEPLDGNLNFLDKYKKELWNFYSNCNTVLHCVNGWENKFLFVEPYSYVFWDIVLFFTQKLYKPGTYGVNKNMLAHNYVLNVHHYPMLKQAGLSLSKKINGDFYKVMDIIRLYARKNNLPVMITEFGFSNFGKGVQDTIRIINAYYQAFESSVKGFRKRNRYIDFYTYHIPSIQWQWDIYHNNHHVLHNNNPNKIRTSGDAWNDEDFSVISNDMKYNSSIEVIKRPFVKKVQGTLLHSYFNCNVFDNSGINIEWGCIKVDNKKFFKDRHFLFAAWKFDKLIKEPTEIFIPNYFDLDASKLNIITNTSFDIEKDESKNLLIKSEGICENNFNICYMLIVSTKKLTNEESYKIEKFIVNQLNKEKSPVFILS